MNVIVSKNNESVIYKGIIYKYGETFEVDASIGKSLIERGYVKDVTYSEPTKEADLQTGHLDKEQLQKMSYSDLKRLAAEMGVNAAGKKDDLIARITAIEVGYEAEAEEEAIEDEASDELPNTDMPE